jgi:hypothetical protein
MAAVSKTIGPLHLEDLEPHRFEDLVRQLLYDFRPRRDLEATGRSESDEGFDVRAWESMIPVADRGAAEEQNYEADDAATARQWLIQCKREKTISPSKLKGIFSRNVRRSKRRALRHHLCCGVRFLKSCARCLLRGDENPRLHGGQIMGKS